jgi:hypothetical protein
LRSVRITSSYFHTKKDYLRWNNFLQMLCHKRWKYTDACIACGQQRALTSSLPPSVPSCSIMLTTLLSPFTHPQPTVLCNFRHVWLSAISSSSLPTLCEESNVI